MLPYDSNAELTKKKKERKSEKFKSIIFGGWIVRHACSTQIFAILFPLFPAANEWKEESWADPRHRGGATLTRQAGKIHRFSPTVVPFGGSNLRPIGYSITSLSQTIPIKRKGRGDQSFRSFHESVGRKDGEKDRRDPLVPHSTPWRQT